MVQSRDPPLTQGHAGLVDASGFHSDWRIIRSVHIKGFDDQTLANQTRSVGFNGKGVGADRIIVVPQHRDREALAGRIEF